MLRDITIQNYRSFKDFTIDGLARVNLLVGSNNIGKTTLLEAVYLLVNQGEPKCLADVLSTRGETLHQQAENYQIKHIFYGHHPSLEETISLRSQQENPLSLQIKLQSSSRLSNSDNLLKPDVTAFELAFVYGDVEIKIPIGDEGSIHVNAFRSAQQSISNLFEQKKVEINFLATTSLSFEMLAPLWDRIALTYKEEEVLKALQIIDRDVERMAFTSRQTFHGGILVKLRGRPEPVPLGIMGDGMRRILTLGMFATISENGFLLVDEIDTGLHYEVQIDMWRLIFKLAQNLNVQVFATTHSWDCIYAFEEVVNELEDPSVGMLFRLSNKYGNLRPVEYTAEDLEIAVRQNIEVR